MTTPFLSYHVPPTGTSGTYARTLPDQLADIVNVKDFGATGDGATDDTVAIKAAFAAAWGPPASPHGGGVGRYNNRPIFFPAGDYIVTDTIYVVDVAGGWLFGEGSGTTRLIYAGSITNKFPTTPTQDKCNLFFTNGFSYCRIEGIAFVMTGGNALSDSTCCFNWNWDGGPGYGGVANQNTTLITFIDVGFQGGTYGCLMADGTGVANGWGHQCDTGIWINCWIDNCYYGTKSVQGNCMNCCWIGGSVKNCSQSGAIGMFGNLPTTMIQGVHFSNNDLDIQYNYPFALLVMNCRSTSSYFCKALASGSIVIGCEHNSASPTFFVGTVGTTQGVAIDNCWTNGALQGAGSFFIRETHFDKPGWAAGTIREFTSTDSFSFAQLPPIANAAEGLTVSIKDSPTATQFAPASAGSGSSHVLLRSNGTNWTVVGK